MQNYWFTRREIRETKRKAYSIHNSNSQIRYWRNIDITSLILYRLIIYRFHLQAFYKTYCTIFLPYSFYEIFHLRERESRMQFREIRLQQNATKELLGRNIISETSVIKLTATITFMIPRLHERIGSYAIFHMNHAAQRQLCPLRSRIKPVTKKLYGLLIVPVEKA